MNIHGSDSFCVQESCPTWDFDCEALIGFDKIRARRVKLLRHSDYCPPVALAVVAGTPATPGISSPRKYFAFPAFMTGIAAYGFE